MIIRNLWGGTMSNFKFAMLCNAIICVAYMICVTTAAMHFDKPGLLWWYILVLALGYSIETQTTKNKEKEDGNIPDREK